MPRDVKEILEFIKGEKDHALHVQLSSMKGINQDIDKYNRALGKERFCHELINFIGE